MNKHTINDEAIRLHKKNGGKIATALKVQLSNKKDLSRAYTPGVAAVCKVIHASPKEARALTIKRNTIAVVTDGSAVLGLGNIGATAALPVMEGKAALFKKFADVDAFPICLDTQDTEEIIRTTKLIAPVFGGINLEDIAAPRCFEIEERLKAELSIPVMHDDQHGTAIVILAGLINALKIVKKKLPSLKIVVAGAGAAGTAFVNLIVQEGAKNILVIDREGIIYTGRPNLNAPKKKLAAITNPLKEKGDLKSALVGADLFIGVSAPNIVTEEMVRSMAKDPIVFALSNPVPEIMPDVARKGGAKVIGTGRSDFPNQLNNALAFPGIFRGALDNKVTKITDEMKRKAAYAIAKLVSRPTPDKIVPDIFDKKLVKAVARAIK